MYELTELFLYKFFFIAEILIAMHLCAFRFKKKSNFILRAILGSVACFVVGYAVPVVSYTPWYTSLMFLALFLICAVSFYFIYDIPIKLLFVLSVTAYTMQHFGHELYKILGNAVGFVFSPTMGMYGDNYIEFGSTRAEAIFLLLVYTEVYLLSYWVLYKIFGKKINREDTYINNFSIAIIGSLILVVEIFLNAVAVYIPDGYNLTYALLTSAYNIICCILILYLQTVLCLQKRTEQELKTVSLLLHQAQEQYKQREENIELLNMKCHDLKHQIREYGKEKKISEDYINELEEILNIYDAPVNTGNRVLDLILTEKSLLCQKKHIKMNCFADCTKLDFISVADAYSLFGNIIDNALDAVSTIDEKEKRIIGITVKNINSFVSIEVQNYYSGQVTLDKHGIPVTTKVDNNYHGYGMKSILAIVKKYDGHIKIGSENGVFSISILFPNAQN